MKRLKVDEEEVELNTINHAPVPTYVLENLCIRGKNGALTSIRKINIYPISIFNYSIVKTLLSLTF